MKGQGQLAFPLPHLFLNLLVIWLTKGLLAKRRGCARAIIEIIFEWIREP